MGFHNIKQKVKEELLGRREELTRLDPEDYSNRQFDRLTIRNSISKHIVYIIFGSVGAILLFLPNQDGELNMLWMFNKNWLAATIVCALPLGLLYLAIRGLIDRTPKLIVDTNGIKTNDWELSWSEIIETKFRFLQGKTTLLIVKASTSEKTIDIGNANIGPRFLGHHIELLKKKISVKSTPHNNMHSVIAGIRGNS